MKANHCQAAYPTHRPAVVIRRLLHLGAPLLSRRASSTTASPRTEPGRVADGWLSQYVCAAVLTGSSGYHAASQPRTPPAALRLGLRLPVGAGLAQRLDVLGHIGAAFHEGHDVVADGGEGRAASGTALPAERLTRKEARPLTLQRTAAQAIRRGAAPLPRRSAMGFTSTTRNKLSTSWLQAETERAHGDRLSV